MCDFISDVTRSLVLRSGREQRRNRCFLDYPQSSERKIYVGSGPCEFHAQREEIIVSYSGAESVSAFETRLAKYIGTQIGQFRTLDLCGLGMPFRNGMDVFRILKEYELDASEFHSLIIDQSSIYPTVSVSAGLLTTANFFFRRAALHNGLNVCNVTCNKIDLERSYVGSSGIYIDGLLCKELNISDIKCSSLIIKNSQIEFINASRADIERIHVLSDTVLGGVKKAPTVVPPLDEPLSWYKDRAISAPKGENAALRPLSEFWLIEAEVNGIIDLAGRSIVGELRLENLTLNAPIRLSKGACLGDFTFADVEFDDSDGRSTSHTPLWERMFRELKSIALGAGDRHNWAHFAVLEHRARLSHDDNVVHRLLFYIDGLLSEHGTNITTSAAWFILQFFLFLGIYVISDCITGRWSSYAAPLEFWFKKIAFSFSQGVRPFSAFEKEFMGHPYASAASVPSVEWLDSYTLVAAALQSSFCLCIFASVLLALRHRLSILN